MKKTSLIGIKITEDFKDALDAAADERGMTPASFSRLCLEICTPFPEKLWEYLDSLSENYNKPHSEIVVTIISKYLCDYIARQRLQPDEPYVVQEFAPIEGKPSLNDIFRILQDASLQKIEVQQKMENQLEILEFTKLCEELTKRLVKKELHEKYSISEKEIDKIYSHANYEAWDEAKYMKKIPSFSNDFNKLKEKEQKTALRKLRGEDDI